MGSVILSRTLTGLPVNTMKRRMTVMRRRRRRKRRRGKRFILPSLHQKRRPRNPGDDPEFPGIPSRASEARGQEQG